MATVEVGDGGGGAGKKWLFCKSGEHASISQGEAGLGQGGCIDSHNLNSSDEIQFLIADTSDNRNRNTVKSSLPWEALGWSWL